MKRKPKPKSPYRAMHIGLCSAVKRLNIDVEEFSFVASSSAEMNDIQTHIHELAHYYALSVYHKNVLNKRPLSARNKLDLVGYLADQGETFVLRNEAHARRIQMFVNRWYELPFSHMSSMCPDLIDPLCRIMKAAPVARCMAAMREIIQEINRG